MANSTKKTIRILPFVIPAILAIIQIIQNYFDSPAFYSRIDPEYLCLLNGLNVSMLKFDNIGYTDLPGTPFILLTGLFIRITYLFTGEGSIYSDVISRPELYLHSASFQLMLLTTGILIWGGKKIISQQEDIIGTIIMQATFFFSGVCIHLPTRYMADRLLPVLVFVFAVQTICYLRAETSEKKYSIISGIIIGIGLITKLNFLPVTIIPLFIIYSLKNKLIYISSTIISSFISFLPIISKFGDVKKFFSSIIFHDGLYGSGEKQVFNLHKFLINLKEIIDLNPSFGIIILLIVFVLVFLIIKKRKQEIFILIAILAASTLEAVMVSKHFKDYYLAPVLALSGLALFVIWDFFNENKGIHQPVKYIVVSLTLVIIILPNQKVGKHSIITKQRNEQRKLSVNFLNENRKPSDWLFLEPSWKADPTVENGLMWGISYVAGRTDYRSYFEEVYPRVLAFEGPDRPISQFRCGDADEKKFVSSKDDIFLMSIPGDQTKLMIEKLITISDKYESTFSYDTIFVNTYNQDIILKGRFLPIELQNQINEKE